MPSDFNNLHYSQILPRKTIYDKSSCESTLYHGKNFSDDSNINSMIKLLCPHENLTCSIRGKVASSVKNLKVPGNQRASFTQHFILAKKKNSRQFSFPVVINGYNEVIAFGWPSEWEDGLALYVINNGCMYGTLEFEMVISNSRDNEVEKYACTNHSIVDRNPSDHNVSRPRLYSNVNRLNWNEINCDNIGYGQHCCAGNRTYNEDRVIVIQNVSKCVFDENMVKVDSDDFRMDEKTVPPSLYCAVYDGHGGEVAVDFVKANLHKVICQSDAYLEGNIYEAIRWGFEHTDRLLFSELFYSDEKKHEENVSNFSSGTTSCSVLIRGNILFVSNLGDSRCLISRGGRSYCVTCDHQLFDNVKEQKRVKAEGGGFAYDGYLEGKLGVSRSFGDFNLESKEKLKGLSSVPDIFVEEIRRDDEFLILGCDGIFEVLSNQEVVNSLRNLLKDGMDPDTAAKTLCDIALKRHSLDNLSVVVLVFQTPQPRVDNPPEATPRRRK